jgi:hypothetical protein
MSLTYGSFVNLDRQTPPRGTIGAVKRSPLKRYTPLKSASRLESRTPLKQVSKKRAQENRQRSKIRAELMDRITSCQAGSIIAPRDPAHRCWRTPSDIHEPLTRARGGSITDPENMVVVCRSCHDWIHRNPLLALELHLLKSRY